MYYLLTVMEKTPDLKNPLGITVEIAYFVLQERMWRLLPCVTVVLIIFGLSPASNSSTLVEPFTYVLF